MKFHQVYVDVKKGSSLNFTWDYTDQPEEKEHAPKITLKS